MKIVGKVLWWDSKDQNGIIIDATGNEFYFDISVVENQKFVFTPGTVVQFKKNETISKISCAKSVFLPPKKSKARLEKEFQRILQLALPL